MDLYFYIFFLTVPTIYVDELYFSSDFEAAQDIIPFVLSILSNEILFRHIDDTEGAKQKYI